MALTKITSTNIGANAVTNTAIGYTPANKAGDTFTGNISLTSSTTPNLYIESSNTSVNQNLWFRSNGTDTFGIEAQSNTGGAGAFLSNRSPGGGINFRTTTSGASLQTAMTIDGAGRMTLPYQPAFRVNATTAQSPTSYSTIIFNADSGTTLFNVGSHYNTSTGIFTAPVAGAYAFQGQVLWQGLSNGTQTDLSVALNGSVRLNTNRRKYSENVTGHGGYMEAQFSIVWKLAANDTVKVLNGSSGTLTVYVNDLNWTWFSGYLVG